MTPTYRRATCGMPRRTDKLPSVYRGPSAHRKEIPPFCGFFTRPSVLWATFDKLMKHTWDECLTRQPIMNSLALKLHKVILRDSVDPLVFSYYRLFFVDCRRTVSRPTSSWRSIPLVIRLENILFIIREFIIDYLLGQVLLHRFPARNRRLFPKTT